MDTILERKFILELWREINFCRKIYKKNIIYSSWDLCSYRTKNITQERESYGQHSDFHYLHFIYIKVSCHQSPWTFILPLKVSLSLFFHGASENIGQHKSWRPSSKFSFSHLSTLFTLTRPEGTFCCQK